MTAIIAAFFTAGVLVLGVNIAMDAWQHRPRYLLQPRRVLKRVMVSIRQTTDDERRAGALLFAVAALLVWARAMGML